jgi:putative hydrolases of HD superfamily
MMMHQTDNATGMAEASRPVSATIAQDETLERQLDFLVEIDRLKSVLRRTPLLYADRRENSAEHSWHVAMMATVLVAYADEPVEIGRVVRMLLVHDIVEIDAGDTFSYDVAAQLDQPEREQRAAARIFGLLPPAQAQELLGLWQEFDAANTPEARFANAVDRLMPLLHNYCAGGGSWQTYGVHCGQVYQRMACIQDASARLWSVVDGLLQDAVARGFLMAAPPAEPNQSTP